MGSSIFQPNNQYFVGSRKYIHSISLMTAVNAEQMTVEINKMIRSNYSLVEYETEYGYVQYDQSKLWISPVSGRPKHIDLIDLSEFDQWLFEILENFKYMYNRINTFRIFTISATSSRILFDKGIDPSALEYRLRQDDDYWYFSALYGDEHAYSSKNIKK